MKYATNPSSASTFSLSSLASQPNSDHNTMRLLVEQLNQRSHNGTIRADNSEKER
jgi:hypothetical protein